MCFRQQHFYQSGCIGGVQSCVPHSPLWLESEWRRHKSVNICMCCVLNWLVFKGGHLARTNSEVQTICLHRNIPNTHHLLQCEFTMHWVRSSMCSLSKGFFYHSNSSMQSCVLQEAWQHTCQQHCFHICGKTWKVYFPLCRIGFSHQENGAEFQEPWNQQQVRNSVFRARWVMFPNLHKVKSTSMWQLVNSGHNDGIIPIFEMLNNDNQLRLDEAMQGGKLLHASGQCREDWCAPKTPRSHFMSH